MEAGRAEKQKKKTWFGARDRVYELGVVAALAERHGLSFQHPQPPVIPVPKQPDPLFWPLLALQCA